MMSIVSHLARTESPRQCLLAYGVRDGSDVTFAAELAGIAAKWPNLHVIKCFSHPRPGDRQGADYHVPGFVSVELLRKALPSPDCDFYLCGPPPFMESLFQGLREWGVADERIRYEAFGPATVRQCDRASKHSEDRPADSVVPGQHAALDSHASVPVTVEPGGRQLMWQGEHESLLDWCEAQGIVVDSGCRAGSCGTCETRLRSGSVRYLDEPAEVRDGCFLPCVSVPDGPITIETR
jgi:Na+-transporting NADH:ubiquinone oxidoreductase subunit NqrF